MLKVYLPLSIYSFSHWFILLIPLGSLCIYICLLLVSTIRNSSLLWISLLSYIFFNFFLFLKLVSGFGFFLLNKNALEVSLTPISFFFSSTMLICTFLIYWIFFICNFIIQKIE